jgi:hypothetical protein
VALKIIKLGMDTRQVVARFEAERQALAILDHPNIARVFDGGATPAGRPYFVMELVRGVPIISYCDDNQLSVRQRLELFVAVCQAVQHAHQKGIIHRDLKPGNVLVASAEGRCVPKVIDFGIAKATNQRLTEKTIFTGVQQMIGTPQYMSPEQAAMTGIDIDTRSDVYSLGALLYELLVGSTPFDPKELRGKAYAEMQRIIREVEPPRPSIRLNATAQTRASVAARRRIEPHALSEILKGELDWIVMRAIEKDRTRRYETANALAADVLRFLAGQAVTAAPPSRRYLLRKFVRRHRGAVFATASVAAALVLGVVGTTLGLLNANHQRGLADQRLLEAGAAKIAEATQRTRAEESAQDAIKGRKEAEAQKREAQREARLARALNYVQEVTFRDYLQAGAGAARFTPAVALERAATEAVHQFAAEPELLATVYQVVGERYYGWGWLKEAERYLEKARSIREGARGPDDPETLMSMHFLALVRQGQGRISEAEQLLKRVIAARRLVLGESHAETLVSMMRLGDLLSASGHPAEAQPLLMATLETRADLYRQTLMWQGVRASEWVSPLMDNPALQERASALYYDEYRRANDERRGAGGSDQRTGTAFLLAAIKHLMKDDRAAEMLLREVLLRTRDEQGERNPIGLAVVEDLCAILDATGRSAAAQTLYSDFVKQRSESLGANNPASLYARHLALRRREACDTAGGALNERRELVNLMKNNLGESHIYTIESMKALSEALRRNDRIQEALTTIDQALALAKQVLGPESSVVGDLLASQDSMYQCIVLKVEGVAQFRRSPDKPWEPIHPGITLMGDSWLRTGPKGTVVLQLPDDSTIALYRLQAMTVASALAGKRNLHLDRLIAGHVHYDISAGGVEHDVTIRTTSATLSIRG